MVAPTLEDDSRKKQRLSNSVIAHNLIVKDAIIDLQLIGEYFENHAFSSDFNLLEKTRNIRRLLSRMRVLNEAFQKSLGVKSYTNDLPF